MECLTCGSKDVDTRKPIYFVLSHMFAAPNSYLLCEKHKNVRYSCDDIYTEDGNRKEIDHEAVIARSKQNGAHTSKS